MGSRLGDSESEATWTDMFAWLKRRGLHGVEVLVSDDHAGLVKAAQRCLPGGDLAAVSGAPGTQCLGADAAAPAGPDGRRDCGGSSRQRTGLRHACAFAALAAALEGKADRALDDLRGGA